MVSNEFWRQISVDFAPQGSVCSCCGKPAERQITAIGGLFHNQRGLFCRSCGDQFSQHMHITRTPATTTESYEHTAQP
jgi:hypothetical protein